MSGWITGKLIWNDAHEASAVETLKRPSDRCFCAEWKNIFKIWSSIRWTLKEKWLKTVLYSPLFRDNTHNSHWRLERQRNGSSWSNMKHGTSCLFISLGTFRGSVAWRTRGSTPISLCKSSLREKWTQGLSPCTELLTWQRRRKMGWNVSPAASLFFMFEGENYLVSTGM